MIKERNLCFSLLIFLLLSLTGCFEDIKVGCDHRQAKIAFQSTEAKFRKEVLVNVANYTKLKDFIIANLDTIFAHNEKDSYAITHHNYGKDDSVKNHIDHLAFHDYGKGNMIKDQVPPYLYPQLKQIYTAFNSKNFYSVDFDRNGTVTIRITNPSEYDSKNIGINHSLEWKKKKVVFEKDSTSLSRDTTLANGWIYTVFIDCYQGI